MTLYTGGDGGENGVASGVGGQRIAGNLLDIDALKLGVEPERDKKESVIRVPAKDIVIPPQVGLYQGQGGGGVRVTF